MRYIGHTCPVCKSVFNEKDEVVVCPRCGTPHHKACWQETNTCVNEDKHDEGFVWQAKKEQSPDREELKPKERATNTCPNCGTINDSIEPNCINCGARIYLGQEPPRAPFEGHVPPHAGQGGSGYGQPIHNINIDGIPANEIMAYVQNNSEVYITKFLQMDKHQAKSGFNWVAAFFPYIWLFYRKLYKAGFLTIALFLLFSFIPVSKIQVENNRASFEIIKAVTANEMTFDEALAEIQKLPEEPAGIRYYISYGLRLALNLFIALKADVFYRKKIVNDVLKSREEAHDMPSYFALLTKKGGVSILAAIGGFALYRLLALFVELYVLNLFF